MLEVKKIATRESYGNALVELGKENPDIVVMDADLAGSTKTGVFRKAFPDRHFNAGIAEANMASIAAGLATTGMIPFISSFAMFASGRAYEQIRNSIAYPHLNVKICASHAGISVGEDGATHQCIEDINLMRGLPGMVVICPADDVETKAAMRAIVDYNGPVYMRLGRLAVPVINDPETYKFEIGKGQILKNGDDVTIISMGLTLANAIEAEKMLAADGISVNLINMPTIKPLDNEMVIEAAKKTGKIIVIEEHSIVGGLGSAVCECLSENYPVPVKRIGINDTFGESGSAADLLHYYKLDAEGIYEQVKEYLSK